jgi:hypothetical protein
LLLDETSLLACAAYVDLNPVRAAMAETPEQSEFTGAKDRIDDVQQRASDSAKTHEWERSRAREQSGWMIPLEINEGTDPVGPDLSPVARRASLKGFLSISLTQYLELLDWTGRQFRPRSRGVIPAHLAPILDRLGIESTMWCELVQKFGRLFKRAAGTAQSLAREAIRRGVGYMHAPGLSMFSSQE